MLDARKEEAFCTILREELQLATGCTEPIAVAYCAARLRQVLGERPRRILAEVSGNILKNVKSVVVPNTGGRRGLPAAIAVGVVAGDPEARLQVIAHVTEEDTAAIQAYLDSTDIRIDCPPTSRMLDIRLTGWAGDHKAVVHVANNHTNIIYVERDGEVLLEKPHSDSAEDNLQDKSVLNVRDILTFAETVDVSRIEESVGRQLECNTAIAREGLRGDWGANIGSTLLLSGGERIIAFSMGSRMNRDYYDVGFEKAFPDVNGAYAMINREFSRMIAEKYPEVQFLNREDDMGSEGLRRAKESYQPTVLLEKYVADWKEN